MSKFVGITIGPIFDTIMDASTPAALWFASSLFSDITRRLCIEIKEQFQDVKIYSTYLDENITTDDGVGKFHDRIIFSTEQYNNEKINNIIKKVKNETCNNFPEDFSSSNTKEFFQQYLQIHYVVLEESEIGNENCILKLSPYLDALELMKTFPKDDSENVIRKLFAGEEDSGNRYIKKSPLFKDVKDNKNQFIKDNKNIWKIDEIASVHNKITENLKRKNYYVVVQADGDGIGKFFQTLNNDMLIDFSKVILSYDEEASKKIANYGGMTIYAGGDDLLFLAPVMNEKGEDIFHLCAEIRNLFQEHIRNTVSLNKSHYIPTVSFGIAIQYKKFPLYEALSRGRTLLGIAKSDKSKKDKMVIDILKHSGSNISVIVPNNSSNVLEKILTFRTEVNENTVNSVLYTLEIFRSIISIMDNKAKNKIMDKITYETAFMNLFDNIEQKPAEDYFKGICRLYWDYFVDNDVQIIVSNHNNSTTNKHDDCKENLPLKAYLSLLQIKKFLVDKEGKED